MQLRLNRTAREMDQQRAKQQLRDGHEMPSHLATGAMPGQKHSHRSDYASVADHSPNNRQSVSFRRCIRMLRNPTREQNMEKPLDYHQSGKKSIHLPQKTVVVGNPQPLQPVIEAADFYLIEVNLQHLELPLAVRRTVNRPNAVLDMCDVDRQLFAALPLHT